MRGWALVVLAAGLAPAPAQGREVWRTKDGELGLEARAFYKSIVTILRLPTGLVDGTEAIAALVPGAPVVPQTGASSAHTARLWGTFLAGEHLELQAGWQLAATVASDPAFSPGALPGGPLPSAPAAAAARRRLVDFDPVLVQEGGFLLLHNLDLLALKLRTSRVDVTVGRQVLSWGSGRLWNPTDLLSPFAPTDVDREIRRGVDAVRLSIRLAATAQLELLWLPQDDLDDQGAVARGQLNLAGFDLAASAAKYVRDVVFGLDATGDAGPLGVHAELAYTYALDRNADGGRDQFLRAVVGADARPTEELVLTGELHFNGWGASDPDGYLAVLRSDRVARGEVFGAGRYYLGLVAAWQASQLVSLQGIALTNLQDPSVLVLPVLEVWAEQSVLVRVGAFLPVGRGPDPSALQWLTPEDAAQQTDAWREATGSLGLRSEYGASPFGVFAQVAVYPL